MRRYRFTCIVLLVAFCTTLVALLTTGTVAQAATLVVDGDGMASATNCADMDPAYLTISLAVMAASPGDTIKVCPGSYAEQCKSTKTV